MHNCIVKIVIIFIAIVNKYSDSFNIHPYPSYTFKEPVLKFNNLKIRASYFGYSIVLQKTRTLIGAPRAQSTLSSQRNINEIGQVYSCNFENRNCEPLFIDKYGDGDVKEDKNDESFKNKTNQWFGATMEGHPSPDGPFIVCAPNIITALNPEKPFLFQGTCHHLENSSSLATPHVLALERSKESNFLRNQSRDDNPDGNPYYAQMGIALHIADDYSQVILGTPGVYSWTGSVVHQNLKKNKKFYKLLAYAPNTLKKYSYFGYAVGSAYFKTQSNSDLLYVTSAPRVMNQLGGVFIYDVQLNFKKKLKKKFIPIVPIKIEKIIYGQQMGEYFGYSLLTDDFNGDGLPDLVVSAPLFANKGSYDNGKVYVFLNKQNLDFEEQPPLYTEFIGSGRFGTTLGKIGDIDGDGFHDIAISAPFEENGVVYIFHGCENGLSPIPSQILKSPDYCRSSCLFGLGLSKGVDINGNDFNDLAIGSLNTDSVYVYETYPVIKIFSQINATRNQISINEKKAKVNICWAYKPMKYDIRFVAEARFTIKLDPYIKRAKFAVNGLEEYSFNINLTKQIECDNFEINLQKTAENVFKPIELELHHIVINHFRDNKRFCKNCIAINPNDKNFTTNHIVFSTGCKSTVCVTDLKIYSKILNLKEPLILGDTSSFIIEYTVENLRETAYFTQVLIQLSETASFLKIPQNCLFENSVLICDLLQGRPVLQNEQTNLNLTIDTSKLKGIELKITAFVRSQSEEDNLNDNTVTNRIPLETTSVVEVIGRSSSPLFSLEEVELETMNVIHEFYIRNFGPSHIQEMNFIVSIPIYYISNIDDTFINVIDFNNLTATGEYDDTTLELEWIFNTTDRMNSKSNKTFISNYMPDSVQPESDSTYLDYEISQNADLQTLNLMDSTFSVDTKEEDEFVKFSNIKVPHERSIYFNCSNVDENEGLCAKLIFKIFNLRALDKVVKISINFTIDLKKIESIYTEYKDILVITTIGKIEKINTNSTISRTYLYPQTIIQKQIEKEIPIAWIVLSIIVGLMVVVLITYGLNKMGFFKRPKKEELQVLVRQSRMPGGFKYDPDYSGSLLQF